MHYEISRSSIGQVYGAISFYYSVCSLRQFYETIANRGDIFSSTHARLSLIEARWSRRIRSLGQLDKHSVISPTPEERSYLDRARALKRRFFESFDSPELSPVVRKFVAQAKEKALLARKAEHVSRIHWALQHAIDRHWYPMFVTLTVAPRAYEDVFAYGSPAFKNYIRRVVRAIGVRLGMSKREAEGADIHEYFAVVERGEANGRLHVHVLHLCKSLPVDCRCPNAGRDVPDHRQLPAWAHFWDHGFVTAIPVRTGPADIYASHGFRWPVELGEAGFYSPYQSAGVAGVANYISKYIGKQLYNQDKERYWRCRMNRMFGLRKLLMLISGRRQIVCPSSERFSLKRKDLTFSVYRLTMRQLWAIWRGYLPNLTLNGRTVPPSLIRRLSIREMTRRLPNTSLRLWSGLQPAPTLVQSLIQPEVYLSRRTLRHTGAFDWLKEALEPPRPTAKVAGLV